MLAAVLGERQHPRLVDLVARCGAIAQHLQEPRVLVLAGDAQRVVQLEAALAAALAPFLATRIMVMVVGVFAVATGRYPCWRVAIQKHGPSTKA